MECIARKIEAGKNISFEKQKIFKNSKQSKPPSVITYNIYNIYNSYKKIDLQFLFIIYIKIMERFQSTKTIEEYKRKSKNANNTKATTQWMKVFCQWAQKRDHLRNIGVLTPDSILQHFLADINKKDEPSSLEAMQGSIDRYWGDSSYDHSRFFKGSRDVLEGKARLLRKKGLGKKPKQKT